MKKFTTRQRLNYWFDNLMARGTSMHFIGLFLFAALMILTIAVLAHLTQDGRELAVPRLIWMSLLRTLDPGTMGGDNGSWPFLFLMLAVTLGGIFVVGTLIGIITNGIDAKLTEMRKGRSLVIESGHTVILGWSNQIFSIISELVIDNQNQMGACIAILADRNKVEMEDEIRARIGDPGHTRVVCRTGNPIDLADLAIINPRSARSIIVLAPENSNPDAEVIKTVLALGRYTDGANFHVVAEVHDSKNIEAAHLVGGDKAYFIQSDELISRITAQTCRQSGLSIIYTELLDFGGDEIYFQIEPLLEGKTFGEALFCYEDSAVIGLRQKDGTIRLNPPMDTPVQRGDAIIAISEDDDTIIPSGLDHYHITDSAIRNVSPPSPQPERTLLLGWNRRAPHIVNELDHYVPSGSFICVVDDQSGGEKKLSECCDHLKNQKIEFKQGEITDRRMLERLSISDFQHVIVLSYSERLDTQQADASTLVTLLHLREINQLEGGRFSIVSEMLDGRNRELAEISRADDFIVSDRLVSLMLSQLSENKELSAVFEDLFDPEGSELYLKPANHYVTPGEPVNFYTVLESARRRGEVAIGYRIAEYGHDPEKSYGVVVNPDKSEPITFTEKDRIILLSEE
jgi:voltage-gated potassium channel Kch